MHMKRCLILLLALVAAAAPAGAYELVNKAHPRLIMDDEAFAGLRVEIEKGENKALVMMHESCLSLADQYGLDTLQLCNTKDASNMRILHWSRKALMRIFTAAYAYRYTGEERYLMHAEADIVRVCSFPDWNPSHFLDVGEMAAAVALGYDWLYNDLKPETRSLVVESLRSKAFAPAADSRQAWFYRKGTNWNQVCNGGLVCAALATFESNESISRRVIDDALRTNPLAMSASYAPDGNYTEGPSYWEYGTSYQVLMLTAFESCLGQDFGISASPGFSRTADYMMYSMGASGQYFNFSDNSAGDGPRGPIWYFAYKFDKPYAVYHELDLLESGRYVHTDLGRLLPLYVYYASKLDYQRISEPAAGMYAGRGITPLVMVRTGWNGDQSDRYLAIKGGSSSTNHAHLDVGSFVYDAYGLRWAADLGSQKYSDVETPIKRLDGSFWSMKQNSLRWEVFRLGNRQHNLLIVNDERYDVTGHAPLIGTVDDDESKGGSFDLSELYPGSLESAVRTAVIKFGEYLEISDALTAPAGKPASVRWNMVTPAAVELVEDGIVLTQKGKSLKLAASGADVQYRTWSADPGDYESPLKGCDGPNPGMTICGFTFDIPAGESVIITTTLK